MKLKTLISTTLAIALLAITPMSASAAELTANRCNSNYTTESHNITQTRVCSGTHVIDTIVPNGYCGTCDTQNEVSADIIQCDTCRATAGPGMWHACIQSGGDGGWDIYPAVLDADDHFNRYCSICARWVQPSSSYHYICGTCGKYYYTNSTHYVSVPHGYYDTSETFTAFALNVSAPATVGITVENATATDYIIPGRQVTLNLAALAGRKYSLSFNGSTSSELTANSYTFTMPNEDVTISIIYDQEPQQISAQSTYATTYNSGAFNLNATVQAA